MTSKAQAQNDRVMDNLEQWVADKAKGLSIEHMRPVLEQSAKDMEAKTKSLAPKNYGKYAQGWNVKIERISKDVLRATMENPTERGRLSWILENGHLTRDHSTWISAQPHVRPAYRMAVKEMKNGVTKVMKQS